MTQNTFIGEANGGRIIQLDVGVQDIALARGNEGYTDPVEAPDMLWLSKPYAPLGESGICLFRRIYLAIRHNAGFAIQVTPFVDGAELVQPGSSTSQAVTKIVSAPIAGAKVEPVEVPIVGMGTTLQIKMITGAVLGEFHLEGMSIGFVPVRRALLK